MSNSIRIPLVEDLESRLPANEKDGLASNIFYDIDENITYATKRPGYISYVAGIGNAGRGIFTYDSILYIWDSSSTTPTTYP